MSQRATGRRRRSPWAAVAGTAVASFVALGALDGVGRVIAFELLAIAVAVGSTRAVARAVGATASGAYDRAANEHGAARRWASLHVRQAERADDVVVLASSSDVRMRRSARWRLREIAQAALVSRRGVHLESQAARDLLGDRVWELLHEGGAEVASSEVAVAELREVIDALERI